MSIGYAYWFPRPYNAYAPHTVIAFDEARQELGFTTRACLTNHDSSQMTMEAITTIAR
jgi:hypothetical protein